MKTLEQVVVREIETYISRLPAAEQEQCNELADHIDRMVRAAEEPVGPLALALAHARHRQKDVEKAPTPQQHTNSGSTT